MTDYRALCVELVEAWDSYSYADAGDAADRMAEAVKAARAALAQPAPPAEGEAAEVAAWLRAYSDEEFGPHNEDPDIRWFARAAELLQQRPEPVPVSERPWEREGFCDVESCCWAIGQRDAWCRVYVPGRDWGNPAYTYCLPATALPLPAGEGK